MHGQSLSAGWPLDRRGSARAHGGTAGGPPRASEAAARAEHPFGSIKQWMNQGTFLLRGLEKGAGRIQPDGAGLQFHPCGEHCGRRDSPQSDVKEGGRLPAGHLTPSRRWLSVMRRPEMATALRDLMPSNATRRSVFTRSGKVLETGELRTTHVQKVGRPQLDL